jgi:TonB family protein
MGKRNSKGIYSRYPHIKGKRIILFAFLVSAIVHLGIIISSPDIFLASVFRADLRTFKVDLIRPPMDEIEDSSEENQVPTSQAPDEQDKTSEEATISLDTTDTIYYPYVKTIKEGIHKNWIYPPSAQKSYIQGDLMIVFRLDKNGTLVNSRIARSSGYQILDGSALNAIELASPFPPFPDTITVQFLNINATFTYQLRFQ